MAKGLAGRTLMAFGDVDGARVALRDALEQAVTIQYRPLIMQLESELADISWPNGAVGF